MRTAAAALGSRVAGGVVPRRVRSGITLLASRFRDAGGSAAALALLLLAGGAMMLSAGAVALSAADQAAVAVATMALFAAVNRIPGRGATLFLVVLSMAVSLRYIVWRLTETLDFTDWSQFALGMLLCVAELYAIVMLLLGYVQTAWPLERRPLPLPADPGGWPAVDVFIPTYDEDLAIVRSTVLAALAMDWPRDRLRVYLLDDGRRPEFRDFAAAAGCGYVVRPDNRHAKAGNLNHALSRTGGAFIAVFDCDHIPTRAFLQMTMGWMVADPRLALLQTPHHFYSPDPFQRNLAAGYRVPAEGNMFYGLVQDGNDFWNATFFCGSCAVIRREALDAVGGFATETVTEDAHTALRLQRRGWSTAYLRLPLAAGLATERLRLHIGQRVRWARGMLQIMRIDNPLWGPGLSAGQRLCYLAAMMHFLFAIPRLVFLLAPLAFLLMGENIIAASPLAITAYALPHIFHSVATGSRLQRNWRYSFWSEIYETVLALFLVRVTVLTLLSPARGRFNVTQKGGLLENGFLDLGATWPNVVLAGLLGAGLLRGLLGMAIEHGDVIRFQAFLLNAVWASFSLLTALGALAVGRETRQTRRSHRIRAELPMSVLMADGRMLPAHSEDLSLGGARLRVDWPEPCDGAVALFAVFHQGGTSIAVPARLLRHREHRAYLRWEPRDLADEAAVVRTVFGRADAWVNWGGYPPDRPLVGLLTVLASIKGLFRPRGHSFRRPSTARERAGVLAPVAEQPRIRTMVLHPGGAAAAVALVGLALGVGVPVSAGPARAEVPAQGQAQVRLTAPDGGAAAEPPLPAIGPNGPAASSPSAASATGTPAAAGDDLGAGGGVTTSRTFRELGATGPMTMRGVSPIQGLFFGVPANSVVTGAQLVLSGAMSPALIPDASAVTITLNEQYVGTLHVDPQHPAFGPVAIPVNPVFFGGENRLNFRFAGQYTRTCNDLLSGLLWSTVSDQSRLVLTTAPIPPRRELSRLPAPFFDPDVREKLVVPVVLPPRPDGAVLGAAAVVASWFGRLSDYRGAGFPVSNELPRSGDAVAIGLPGQLPAELGLPAPDGPTLVELPNPNDPNGTVLAVSGRDGTELAAAVRALALGTDTLPASDRAVVAAPDAPARRPYDAPAFVPTDRPVRFGELVPAGALEGTGYVPGTISVPFRTEPDLYTWRSRPFGVRLGFRSPDGPILDVATSRLDVGINGMFLRSYSLAPPDGPAVWLQRLLRLDAGPNRGGAAVPPWMVFGQNQLQLYFDARPLHRGECAAVPGDVHTAVDADSVLDLTRAYHFTTLPNLAFFAGAGFPFTRLADLADTAVVLPPAPGTVMLSAFLDLMGFMGATTWYPATGVAVVTADRLDTVAGRDLILMGTPADMVPAASALAASPYRIENGRLSLSRRGMLDGIWYLFGGAGASAEAASGGATDGNGAVRRQPRITGLDTALSGGGALVAAQSPFRAHRSVVALLGGSPQDLDRVVQALTGKAEQPRIQGDLTLLNGRQVTAYRTGPDYTVGSLPFWLWPDWELRDRPLRVLAVILLGSAAAGIALFRLLWARVRRRTRQLEDQERRARRRAREPVA